MIGRLRNITGFVVATLVVAWASVASSAEYFIMAEASSGFARIQRGSLHANGHADNAMRFELVRLRGDRVALRAPDGSYLRAGVGQQTLLATGSPHIRGWETFELVNHDGAGGLRAVQNGLYVEVDPRTGRLSATASRYSSRTVIRLVSAPQRNVPNVRAPQHSADRWTGRWTQLWVADDGGALQRSPRGSSNDFTISTARNVEMTAGCNTVSADMSVDGSRVRFGPAMITRKMCSNPQQRFEASFARSLASVRSHEFREGQVVFLDGRGRTVFQIGR